MILSKEKYKQITHLKDYKSVEKAICDVYNHINKTEETPSELRTKHLEYIASYSNNADSRLLDMLQMLHLSIRELAEDLDKEINGDK